MSEVDDIRAQGWTQGSVLAVDTDLAITVLEEDARFLVVSHPCDVASPSLERDPTVELLRMAVVDAVDGNLTFGKNPRRLHLVSPIGVVEVDFTGRVTVARTVLAEGAPEFTFAEEDRRVLASWLAARYARPAFADEFNRRMTPAMRNVERILKSAGSRVSGIYVGTTLSELDADSNYQLHMAFTMLSDDFEAAEIFAGVSEAVDQIAGLITGLSGIDVVQISVVSEADFTLDALRTYARWDYDALSFKEGGESALPATW